MGALTGLVAQGSYSAATDTNTLFDALLSLLADPDASMVGGTGATVNAGQGANHLDEMSPGALAQLRVELLAMRAKANNSALEP